MIKAKDLVLGVGFDNTVVLDYYPSIGPEVPGALECLRHYQSQGVKLILCSTRADPEIWLGVPQGRKVLQEAINYLNDAGLYLYGVNRNPTQDPRAKKALAHAYLDSYNVGAPVKELGNHVVLNWGTVDLLLSTRFALNAYYRR